LGFQRKKGAGLTRPMQDPMDSLTNPSRLYTRAEVVSTTNPIPKVAGAYAWFFKEPPGVCPTDGCVTKDEWVLLYVGISPGSKGSDQNIRKRIRTHYKGRAESSTLRLTLGVLLEKESGFPLCMTVSGKSLSFTREGEQWLNGWMQKSARVCWVEHSDPWELEDKILDTLSLPLNLKDNQNHPFYHELKMLRKQAKNKAKKG
jgi:hypothetical protein